MSTLSRPLPRSTSPAHWARLRLVSDEGLLRLVRGGDERAFDVLVRRYDAPLHAFCRHMLSSREDAEDVMQETWSSAYRAMVRDDRQLTIRAWLYAIARNTCLNSMRTSGPRPTLVPVGVSDESDGGVLHRLPTADSAAEALADRERFRVLIGDIQELPENQRTALVLHELDALSYDEIAGVLDVSVGAVKSLLVRARVGLTESAEARELDCDDVRMELAAVAQKVGKLRSPTRAHVRNCEDCAQFGQRLKKTNRSLTAAIAPLPIIGAWLQKIGLGKLTGGGVAAGSAAGGAGALSAGGGALALKAAATVAAAALATAGATEVRHLSTEKSGGAGPAAKTASDTAKPAPVQVAATDDTPVKVSAPTDGAEGKSPAKAVTAEDITPGPTVNAAATAKPTAPATRQSSSSSPVSVDESSSTSAASGRPHVEQQTGPNGGRPTVSLPEQAPVEPLSQAPAATDAPPASGTTTP